jgi:hypothetical protein
MNAVAINAGPLCVPAGRENVHSRCGGALRLHRRGERDVPAPAKLFLGPPDGARFRDRCPGVPPMQRASTDSRRHSSAGEHPKNSRVPQPPDAGPRPSRPLLSNPSSTNFFSGLQESVRPKERCSRPLHGLNRSSNTWSQAPKIAAVPRRIVPS